MAIGKASDFTIYNEEFNAAVTETLVQETNIFNGASRNAITLRTNAHRGNYIRESFFQSISGLAARRDTTSVATVTDTAMTTAEQVAVKLNRKIINVAQTLDAWRKIMMDLGPDPESQNSQFSYLLGQQVAKAIAVDYVDSAINACTAALSNVGGLTYDVSAASPSTISHTYLASTLAKMGDAANNIVCFVMHSAMYWALVKQAITDEVFEVAGVTIQTGNVATFSRPVIITDSAQLISAASPTDYYTLALTANAIEVMESETREMYADLVTGLENLVVRLQGEYAFTLKLKGFTWDVTNGGANPTDAALGTGSNWDQVATSVKDCAGVVLISQ